MSLRYNGGEPNTVDLQLSECGCALKGVFANVTSLKQWNIADPVDDAEISRNDQACQFFQKNRNPFIDFPWLSGMFDYSYFIAPCSPC